LKALREVNTMNSRGLTQSTLRGDGREHASTHHLDVFTDAKETKREENKKKNNFLNM